MGGRWSEGSKKYRYIGLTLSILWAILITGYLASKEINPIDLKPNEFGDFLAGVLGPLGILWIILGFWQQGDELRSSVEALNLQSEELRNSVEQQKALVEVTKRQAEAEIQALRDDRLARKKSALPLLSLYGGGGRIHGGKNKTAINIKNLGADCTKVILTLRSSEAPVVIGNLPFLGYGEGHRFSFSYDQSILDAELDITFIDKDGEHGVFSWSLKRESSTIVGYKLTEITSKSQTASPRDA